jgi:hypothetical protein
MRAIVAQVVVIAFSLMQSTSGVLAEEKQQHDTRVSKEKQLNQAISNIISDRDRTLKESTRNIRARSVQPDTKSSVPTSSGTVRAE